MKKALTLLSVLCLASCGGGSDVGRYQLHQSPDGSLRYLLDTATGRTYTETSSGWGLHRALGEDG